MSYFKNNKRKGVKNEGVKICYSMILIWKCILGFGYMVNKRIKVIGSCVYFIGRVKILVFLDCRLN